MKKRYYISFFLIFLFISEVSFSQDFSEKEIFQIDSLTTIINAPSNSDSIIVHSYLYLSDYYQNTPDSSIQICLKAMKLAESANYINGKSGAYSRLGYLYQLKGDNSKMFTYFNKALKIYVSQKDKEGIATSLSNIGVAYHYQGDINNALKYYHKGLKIQEEINNKYGIANSLNNIGSIHKQQGNIKKALDYYHQSLSIREENNDQLGISNSLHNIGSIYKIYGDSSQINSTNKTKNANYLKALSYYEKSLVILQEIEHQYGIATTLNSIGSIYELLNDNTNALTYYKEALSIRENLGSENGKANSLVSIGTIFYKELHFKKAEKYAKQGLTISQKIGAPQSTMASAKLLCDIYEHQNKGLLAVKMYKLFIVMRDSIKNEDTQKSTTLQQAKYEYEKQRAINYSENKKLIIIQQKDKENQRKISFIIGSGLVIVLILLLIVFNRLQVTKKQKVLIEEQKKIVDDINETLKQKNKENLTLVKEIHHRVKNNLQIIISLLRLQKGELKSEEAKEHFTEAINRIMVMSLIHKKLYQQEELASISIQSYLQDLSADIISLTSLGKPVKVVIHSNIKTIGLKTIVPLGLLTNELIINSLKHAFENKKEGTINITINKNGGSDFLLTYADNGEWVQPKEEHPSFGIELIEILTSQLEGTQTRTSNEEGTTYLFSLKNIDLEK